MIIRLVVCSCARVCRDCVRLTAGTLSQTTQLSEMNAEAQSVVDSSASALEYAFKKKGISADMFPTGSAAAAAAPAPAAEVSE